VSTVAQSAQTTGWFGAALERCSVAPFAFWLRMLIRGAWCKFRLLKVHSSPCFSECRKIIYLMSCILVCNKTLLWLCFVSYSTARARAINLGLVQLLLALAPFLLELENNRHYFLCVLSLCGYALFINNAWCTWNDRKKLSVKQWPWLFSFSLSRFGIVWEDAQKQIKRIVKARAQWNFGPDPLRAYQIIR
jgi:hypothetical protein